MTLLILGCAVFLAGHFIAVLGYRARMEAAIGHNGYMGTISLISVIGITLIVVGYKQVEMSLVWVPLPSAYALALHLMPIAAILLVAGNVPCNIARFVPHSMLTGIVLWAALHLLANGDVASTIIFVTFGGYALYRRFTLEAKPVAPQPIYRDVLVVILGAGVYAVLLRFHETLSGIGLAL